MNKTEGFIAGCLLTLSTTHLQQAVAGIPVADGLNISQSTISASLAVNEGASSHSEGKLLPLLNQSKVSWKLQLKALLLMATTLLLGTTRWLTS